MLNMCFKILENAKQLMFLSLKSIDNIKKCNHLIFNMLNVCYCIINNTFKKDLENTLNLIVNYSRNTLDIIMTHETMNNKLNNAYNVVL